MPAPRKPVQSPLVLLLAFSAFSMQDDTWICRCALASRCQPISARACPILLFICTATFIAFDVGCANGRCFAIFVEKFFRVRNTEDGLYAHAIQTTYGVTMEYFVLRTNY